MSTIALACTGDPLLDQLLAECSSFSLHPMLCESAADALHEVVTARPALLFTSPALGEGSWLEQVKGVRLCWLREGEGPEPPAGVEVLGAERLTPQLIDAWVRRPGRPGAARRTPAIPPPRPIPVPPQPPQARVTTSEKAAPSPAPAAKASPRPVPAPTGAAPRSPARPRPQPPAPRPVINVLRQQVISFWGGKPGAGRSTLVAALGDLLARAGELRVCTVDLNPYNSSLAPLLGKEQEVTSWLQLTEAMAKGQPFPMDALRWVRPNWAMVSGPDGRPEWISQLKPESIAWMVQGLRTQFDYIILDPEARPGPISESAAQLAQLILVTVSPDYPDVLDTARAFEAGLEQGWLDRGRCRLILSRWLESPHLAMGEVGDCFGLPVSLTVPLVPEATIHASGQGVPVTQVTVRGAEPLQQALGGLVSLVAPPVAAAAATSAKGAFGSQWRGWLRR